MDYGKYKPHGDECSRYNRIHQKRSLGDINDDDIDNICRFSSLEKKSKYVDM